jgi:histidinol phosphatase-like enzyme (inositol monophosphatase family)
VALDAARAAGDVAVRWFRADPPTETKPDGTVVTLADRDAERAMHDVLVHAFPGHSIVGEEHGVRAADGPVRWILDPIDGTESYVRGVPLWGVLVAAEVRGRVVAGVCHMPAVGETVAAARGLGCTWNGRPCRVSSTARLADAMLLVTSPRVARDSSARWTTLEDRVRKVRGWSDCYGYALVATGRADVVVDPRMAVWDCGPFPVILEEAGGRFSDWSGAPRIDGGNAVATNGLLHDEVLAVLRGA